MADSGLITRDGRQIVTVGRNQICYSGRSEMGRGIEQGANLMLAWRRKAL